MQDHRENVLAARAAVAATATLGTVAGFWLGCALVISLAERQLNAYMERVSIQQAAALQEADRLLDSLRHSAYASCSDGELGYFRDLVFRSDYLKDAGRIHAGRIQCSAAAGHPSHPIGHFTTLAPRTHTTSALTALVPIGDKSQGKTGMEQGDLFVLFGSHLPVVEGSLPIHPAVSLDDAKPSASSYRALPNDAQSESTYAVTREGNLLIARQCSVLQSRCVTASVSVDQARRAALVAIYGASALGGMAGVGLGMLLCHLCRRRLSLDQELKKALAGDRLQLEYQPIVNLANGQIVGAEALARWTNRDGVSISPDVFIKVAEDHGFVGLITTHVVKRALKDFCEVMRTRPGFQLNINVAPADLLDAQFLPMLDEVVKQANVPTRSLAFEVTERSAATDQDALETIHELRRRGYSIHIDDFGTGYSNLSYLLYLSVDTIKIDKAFVRAVGTDSPSVAIVPQIVAMARSLNLGVVVEGIENESQASYFSTKNLRIYGQGWLYGRPMPAGEFFKRMGVAVNQAPAAGHDAAAAPRGWPQHGQRVPTAIAS
jgi:sensor c-di-GMP phosphodiesterase-like protein